MKIKGIIAFTTVLFSVLGVVAQNSVISGNVSDANNAAVKNARVILKRGDTPIATVQTDENGNFSFPNVASGNYRVTVSATGFISSTQETNGNDLNFKLDVAGVAETIYVTGEPDGYAAETATTGAKLDLPLIEQPQAVSTVPKAIFADRAIIRLTETADNVSGIRPLTGYTGTLSNNYIFRGFGQNFGNANLRNGFQEYAFLTQRDVVNIERIEFLKGPTSLFYGANEVGGVVNTITKKPQSDRRIELGFTTSTFGLVRPTVDATGSLNKSKSLLYRVNFAFDQAESHRDLVNNRNVFIAPSLLWKIGSKTTFGAEFEYGNFRNDFDRGFPLREIFLTEAVNKNYAEPFTKGLNRNYNLMLNFTHQFNDALGIRSGFSHIRSYTDTNAVGFGFFPLALDNRTINRDNFVTDEYSENYNSQNEFYARFKTGSIKHNLVAGVDYARYRFKYTFDFKAIASIDRITPVYGALPTFDLFGFNDDSFANAFGVYVQDQVDLTDRVKITLGGRGTFVDSTSRDINTLAITNTQKDNSFTPRAGIVVLPTQNTSIYFSYANSFQPNFAARSLTGAQFKPTTGRQFEGGVKQNLFRNRMFATLAIYELTKRDVLVPDPANPFGFSIQIGEQRSRGLELELNGQVTPNLNLSFNYTAVDASITKDSQPDFVGDRLAGVPRQSGGLYANYNFGRGFSAGGGIYAVGRRFVDVPNQTWQMPAYARVDVNFGYRNENWRFDVAVKNLNDKRYFEVGGFGSMMPQASRHAVASVIYVFR